MFMNLRSQIKWYLILILFVIVSPSQAQQLPFFRPSFISGDVKNATLYDIQAQKAATASYFLLKNVNDLQVCRMESVKDTYIKSTEKKVFWPTCINYFVTPHLFRV